MLQWIKRINLDLLLTRYIPKRKEKGNEEKGIEESGTDSMYYLAGASVWGCGDTSDGKIEVEIVQYKPEAANYFKTVEDAFNATHDDIHLTISSPNDAMAILKTRFIREDYPDIIGIGGDINYSYFVDADILADISGYEGMKDVNEGYLEIAEALELVPVEGTYILPYAANAAGVLYNREMFEEHGWQIPETWDELNTLCEEISAEGILPFYFGFKDIWTCLAPWNAMAVELAPADTTKQVNRGRRHLPTSMANLRKSIWRFCLTDRTIRLPTATTMPAPPLPEGNPPCIRSAATRRPRFCR